MPSTCLRPTPLPCSRLLAHSALGERQHNVARISRQIANTSATSYMTDDDVVQTTEYDVRKKKPETCCCCLHIKPIISTLMDIQHIHMSLYVLIPLLPPRETQVPWSQRGARSLHRNTGWNKNSAGFLVTANLQAYYCTCTKNATGDSKYTNARYPDGYPLSLQQQ